jgi:signal transduction histidine kinase
MNNSNILVIDDELGIREGCKRALSAQGYYVETAENGDEGLRKVLSGNFDLVLIDVMMPGTSGIDLISQIHQHKSDMVCIIITGFATVELAVRAIKEGAYDFLTKPFTTDELILVVNQGLERRELYLETKRLQKIEAEAQCLIEEKAKLEELDRAKLAFIQLVTHELQAPISAIITYLDIILNGYVTPEQQKEILERAQERAKEQLNLISDLLEFGRLKEIKSYEKPGLINVEVILGTVLQELESQASEKKLIISTIISPGLDQINIAANHMKSIWTNLISNSIKYTPSGGSIDIFVKQENSNILGQVKDSGIGIPDDAKKYLFSEFFRAQNAKALNIPGTGLGLAIIKQIIEKENGKIWVESELNKGSTFSFLIPISK